MIVYLDLDRTLFRTHDSGRQIWDVVGELYEQVDSAKAYAKREDYYITVGNLYYHDMSAQLRDLGLEPQDVYEALLKTDLADGRFEIYGCHDLVKSLEKDGYEPRVFTFGPDDFQRFKTSLCPSLRELPVITTLRPKHEHLDLSEEECWLVDDKPIGDELPGSVSFVQVSLESNEVLPETDWPIFYSLRDVETFFNELCEDED